MDELEDIKKLAQTCLDNLNERHYYRSPNEANTIDNLKNIVLIINKYQTKEKILIVQNTQRLNPDRLDPNDKPGPEHFL